MPSPERECVSGGQGLGFCRMLGLRSWPRALSGGTEQGVAAGREAWDAGSEEPPAGTISLPHPELHGDPLAPLFLRSLTAGFLSSRTSPMSGPARLRSCTAPSVHILRAGAWLLFPPHAREITAPNNGPAAVLRGLGKS